MFRKVALLIIAVGFSLSVSACGKTGDLYLPDDKAGDSSESSTSK